MRPPSKLYIIMLLVFECAKFRLDSQALASFLNMSNNLGINIEALRDSDNLFGNFWTYIDFHAVSHVEYLIHLFPVCS